MKEHLNNKSSNGVIKLGVASVDKDSQCNAVYDVGGGKLLPYIRNARLCDGLHIGDKQQ